MSITWPITLNRNIVNELNEYCTKKNRGQAEVITKALILFFDREDFANRNGLGTVRAFSYSDPSNEEKKY
jgi:hypothetical protein